jgi:hypothetical protein
MQRWDILEKGMGVFRSSRRLRRSALEVENPVLAIYLTSSC